MNNLNQNNKSSARNTTGQNQNLARALLEREKNANSYIHSSDGGHDQLDAFARALSQSGGDAFSSLDNNERRIQASELAQQQKEALRQKLHDRINPVETHEIFTAQAERNLKELQATREELKMLAADIKNLDKEIDLALSREVVDPGTTGIGFFNFFHKLREWIMLLRQQVNSARTWMNQVAGKGKKGRGTAFSFKNSKSVHDAMNSERNFGMNMGG
ncbi:MAG: hypothetical protein GX559_00665 [Candidatus Pacebacteria bacterium]|nr:hypothetical protein [Candidatus Paceibacterota bacterium]